MDFRSAREIVILAPGRTEGARRWRAVSQRVPRDAYRRIAKTDVLGLTPHPGRRDAVRSARTEFRESNEPTRKDSPCRDDSREGTCERSPNRSDLGSASRICVARARLVAKPSGWVKVRAARRFLHSIILQEHREARPTSGASANSSSWSTESTTVRGWRHSGPTT